MLLLLVIIVIVVVLVVVVVVIVTVIVIMEDVELTRPATNTSNVIANGINTNNISVTLDGKPYHDPKSSTSSKVTVRNKIYSTIWEGIKNTGVRIFTGMEYIGEIVAHLIGLDQSRYYYYYYLYYYLYY